MNRPNTCSSNHKTTLASLKADSTHIVIVPVNIPRVKQQSVP